MTSKLVFAADKSKEQHKYKKAEIMALQQKAVSQQALIITKQIVIAVLRFPGLGDLRNVYYRKYWVDLVSNQQQKMQAAHVKSKHRLTQ